MANIMHRQGRRTIFFSDHALDRYWQRYLDSYPHAGRRECRIQLKQELVEASWKHNPPPWSGMSLWHAARCDGCLMLDDQRCFVINKNASGDLVAVTFLTKNLNGA